jgi:hypothetical protein
VKEVLNGPAGENDRLEPWLMVMLTGIWSGELEVVPKVVIVTVPFQVTGRLVRPARVAVLIEMVSGTPVPFGPCRLPLTGAVPPLMNSQLGGPLLWDIVAVNGTVQDGCAGWVAQIAPPLFGAALRPRLVVTLLGEVVVPLAKAVNAAPAAGSVLVIAGTLPTVRVTRARTVVGCGAG